MRFVIPLPPNRANARGHWRKHQTARLLYWEMLDNIAAFGRTVTQPGNWCAPGSPAAPLAKAKATATLYVHQRMDAGNALNRLKWTEDWLVERGFIVDDSPEHLEWTGIPTQVIDRNRPRIELTLEAA